MTPFIGIQLIYVSIAVLKIEIIHKSVDNVKKLNSCYDYVVIGLGSAGSVVANRLAEDQNNRVLGLEAGVTQSAITDIPAFYGLLPGSDYDWKYQTVPQEHVAQAFIGHRVSQPRGRVIGGTSTINAMIYNRGNRKDYDNWAQTYGAIGWDYNNVLKYFIKAENNSDSRIVSENSEYHGINGPVGISSPSNSDSILLDLIRAMNSLGFSTIDINGAQQTGTSIYQMFVKNGLRSSTANAYLEPNPYPNNLFISIKSFVTKILFKNLTAIGVEFIKNNKKFTVFAKKEIILSAGAINSPQILMISGIGPKDHLNQLKIPVLADLPVGHNLKDHLIFEIFGIFNDENKVNNIQYSPQLSVADLYKLYANRSGILTPFPIGVTYYSTKYNDDNSWPNTALFAFPQKFNPNLSQFILKYETLTQHQWLEYYSQLINKSLIRLSPYLGRIKSVGKISLNSSDPFDPPLIDPKYLSDKRDLGDYVEIVRLAFIILEKSLLSSEVTIPERPIPGCDYCLNIPIHECYPYFKCLIKQIGRTVHHQSGTCRMGSVHRSDVVVDERLRVKSIKKLRVIDASVMPEIPNSNTNAATIMIGELGSDLIKADNR